MNLEQLYNLYQEAENGVTTDTRKCGPGMLFFAIKGENFDGNSFAQEALKKGCIASVVDDEELGQSEGDGGRRQCPCNDSALVDNASQKLQHPRTGTYWKQWEDNHERVNEGRSVKQIQRSRN